MLAISIHAPPRGATFLEVSCTRPRLISIHAPPRGATFGHTVSTDSASFQFTPLREGRRQWRCKQWLTLYFNSRPSARGDDGGGSRRNGLHRISIHAPPRGATSGGVRQTADASNFNSRPSARGDPLFLSENTTMDNFNSRPSARGDTQRA